MVVKTIVGFMNSNERDLLIGIDDRWNILGLEYDYASLKTKNQVAEI